MTRTALLHAQTPGGDPQHPLDGIEAPATLRGAACAHPSTDPDAWFPKNGDYTYPLQFCTRCPVAAGCLDWAMTKEATAATAFGRHGMYGGLTPEQRAELASERRTG